MNFVRKTFVSDAEAIELYDSHKREGHNISIMPPQVLNLPATHAGRKEPLKVGKIYCHDCVQSAFINQATFEALMSHQREQPRV